MAPLTPKKGTILETPIINQDGQFIAIMTGRVVKLKKHQSL
jgi:flagellar basal body P-ring protein FlgI